MCLWVLLSVWLSAHPLVLPLVCRSAHKSELSWVMLSAMALRRTCALAPATDRMLRA